MSTYLVDRIAAVKFPKERTGYYQTCYLIATLGGDNNVFNARTNRRARHWTAWAAGARYRCLKWACEFASEFCGGCIRMAHGRSSPEGFIRACRKVLGEAPDYDAPERTVRLSNTAITFDAEEKNHSQKYEFDRLVQKRGQPELRKGVYLRGDVEAFAFDFTQPREAAAFIEHLPYKSPLWHHLKIIGPGEV